MKRLQFRSSRHATELEVCAFRSRFQQGALDTQKNEVERVHCDSDLRSARTGHGSRSTAELAGGVPSPSASSPAPALGYTVNRNFDSAGYLRGIQYPDGDVIGQYNGSGTPLGYDQAGRLTSIPGILNSVTYNALGSPLVQTNANGTTTTKTYDPNRFWLTAISTTTPSVTVQNLSYTLNEMGMALQVGSAIPNEQWTYTYDNLGRLTSSANGVPANNQTWTYNNVGNILTNSVAGNYTYAGPRPHAVTSITGGPIGSLSFTYDANGNMETGNGRSIAWRSDNLPSSVTMTATSTTTSFTYDPFGERVKKTTGATSTVYPFGDDYEINAGVVTKYVNAGFGVIAKRVGSTNYWLHTDRLGSINATTDNTAAEVLRRTYRAYGDLLGQTGTNTESRGYIDQRQDPETGMTYLHARLYDSKLGVFVSPDPSRPLARGVGLNLYAYGMGDPVNGKDPSGLGCWDVNGQTFCDGGETDVYPGGGPGGPGGRIPGGGTGGGDDGKCRPPANLTGGGGPWECPDGSGGTGGGDDGDFCSLHPGAPECPPKPDCDPTDPNGDCYEEPSCFAGIAGCGTDDGSKTKIPEFDDTVDKAKKLFRQARDLFRNDEDDILRRYRHGNECRAQSFGDRFSANVTSTLQFATQTTLGNTAGLSAARAVAGAAAPEIGALAVGTYGGGAIASGGLAVGYGITVGAAFLGGVEAGAFIEAAAFKFGCSVQW